MDHEEMSSAVHRALDHDVSHTHGIHHGHDHNHEHPASNVSIDLPDIIKWLASKRSTLWSVWAIDDDKGKEQAAQWFYREIESLIHHAISSRVPQETKG